MMTCLNMFTSKNGISRNLIPEAIILGYPKTDYNKLNTTFGAYAQVYICNTTITKQKMVGAITLSPENKCGRYYFMPLSTGKISIPSYGLKYPLMNNYYRG